MPLYVDGFVVPVPKKNVQAYRRMAQKAGRIWRAHRDRVNAKVMKDPRLADMMDPKAMPFDAKGMIYGGFKILVAA
jgi:uncharacterized protein YbaA (DUF1428 family)